MSTLRVTTITTPSGGQPTIEGLARAWVNFNGTGTVAIRASLNVSSITDNGTGQYTVNFITAMPDDNYCVVSELSDPSSANPTNGMSTLLYSTSTTSLRIHCGVQSTGYYDTPKAHLAIFR